MKTAIQQVNASSQEDRNPFHGGDLARVGDMWNLATYFREIGAERLLTAEEELDLAAGVGNGDSAARERMIRANLRLVVFVAREHPCEGVSLWDLIAEGNIGLMKAVDRYKPGYNCRFATYAVFWIRWAIRRARRMYGRNIRISGSMQDRMHRFREIRFRMSEALGREPTTDEISKETGICPKQLEQMRVSGLREVSLDTPLFQGDDATTIGSVLADENERDPSEAVGILEIGGKLKCILETLGCRERLVINERFGLHSRTPRSLSEIGATLGVSRERVRQIEKQALDKIRARLS